MQDNLIGKVFGKLTVVEGFRIREAIDPSGKTRKRLELKCQCECNTFIYVDKYNLTKRNTTSCGCLRKTQIIGTKRNKLTVNNIIDEKYIECKCDCGNICKVMRVNFQDGHTKSCGCIRSNFEYNTRGIDLVNQRFSKLIALEDVGRPEGTNCRQWKCQCDCGNITVVTSNDLRTGNTKSCGCIFTEPKQDPIRQIATEIYNESYNDADITLDKFIELSQQNCFYCNKVPNKIRKHRYFKNHNFKFTYNGLDRINSDLPHTIKNCVTSCYECNKAKNNLPFNLFILHIEKLYNNIIILNNKNYNNFNIVLNINNPNITSNVDHVFNSYKHRHPGNLTINDFFHDLIRQETNDFSRWRNVAPLDYFRFLSLFFDIW